MWSTLREWFQISGRGYTSGIMFVVHRVTGLLMVCLLLLHLYLFDLSLFLGYNLLKPLLIVAIFHGLNGIRLALQEFGLFYRQRKKISLIVAFLWTLGSSIVFVIV